MSELLDKQVNVQNESLFQGSSKLLQASLDHNHEFDESRRIKYVCYVFLTVMCLCSYDLLVMSLTILKVKVNTSSRLTVV